MAMPPVAPEVDQDVLFELLPKGDGQPRGMDHGLRVVGVDVEDRDLEHLRHIRGVRCAARLLRAGGKTDLVVDDDVDRPTRAIPLKLAEVQRFEDGALPCERGIAVQQNWDHALAVGIVQVRLLGVDDALDDRIHQFQVARVGAERQMDLAALGRHVIVGISQVIFDVAIHLTILRQEGLFEFAEDDLVRLAQHMGQHVEPAPMRHPLLCLSVSLLHPSLIGLVHGLLMLAVKKAAQQARARANRGPQPRIAGDRADERATSRTRGAPGERGLFGRAQSGTAPDGDEGHHKHDE
jgi:hypothetical protein